MVGETFYKQLCAFKKNDFEDLFATGSQEPDRCNLKSSCHGPGTLCVLAFSYAWRGLLCQASSGPLPFAFFTFALPVAKVTAAGLLYNFSFCYSPQGKVCSALSQPKLRRASLTVSLLTAAGFHPKLKQTSSTMGMYCIGRYAAARAAI